MELLDIRVVPALTDNYIYLARDTQTGTVAVIDPGEAEPVEAALAALGWRLSLILLTHHHADHTAGTAALRGRWHARVIGAAADASRLPEPDEVVEEGDSFLIGNRKVDVLAVPGHTSGHIAFHVPDAAALFAGDTLFSLGCGRLFEGTPAQMWDSLKKLRALPPETRLACGHEYTEANARWALSVDPENAALQARVAEVAQLRREGKPTVPTLLGVEVAANPFLRADDPDLAARLSLVGAPPEMVFAALRHGKDHFRG